MSQRGNPSPPVVVSMAVTAQSYPDLDQGKELISSEGTTGETLKTLNLIPNLIRKRRI